MKHFIRKLASTVRILTCLGMARTFGQYQHSGWDGSISYARYHWRDRDWIIPTSAVHGEEETPALGMPPPASQRRNL